jgi:hypothetical protein
MSRKTVMACLMVLSFLTAASAFGADVKGMIISRTGDTLIVKTSSGNVTVAITGDTTTKDDKGIFGLDKEHLSDVVLIPGFKVEPRSWPRPRLA